MTAPVPYPRLWEAQVSEGDGDVPTTPTASLSTEVTVLLSIIHTLQSQLQATNRVNSQLAASLARLQSGQATPTPATPTPAPATPAPARPNQATPTPVTPTPVTPTTDTNASAAAPGTTTTISAPIQCSPSNHTPPVPSGSGAGSSEIFKEMTKNNRHGRLGRAYMADVDALPAAELMSLDRYLRHVLQQMLPPGESSYVLNTRMVFLGLAALGLHLADIDQYLEPPSLGPQALPSDSTANRAKNLAERYYANRNQRYDGYWLGVLIETLTELSKYRGLFDNEGFLKEDK